MKKIFVLISFFAAVLFLSNTSFAQQNRREELDREIESIMKARNELMRSLLDDDSFSNFDDHVNSLMKQFEQESMGLMQGHGMGAVVGEYDWQETETHQNLIIKVKQIKDKPLDIKIEKGQVKLKGDVEEVLDYPGRKGKKISKIHFERNFSIPAGVDETNPEFVSKDGELQIKFKKLKSDSSPKNSKKILHDDREPVGKDKEDAVI
jgi:HSP20 family molecular chaperone IbpA